MLGDFADFFNNSDDTSTELTNLFWIFFLLATLIVMVIMLNLVIAIICDTYDKVIGAELLANNYERASILYDLEKELSAKAKYYIKASGILKTYIFVTDYENESENSFADFYTDRMRTKIDRIEIKSFKNEVKLSKLDYKFDLVEDCQKRTLNKIENIERSLKKIKI